MPHLIFFLILNSVICSADFEASSVTGHATAQMSVSVTARTESNYQQHIVMSPVTHPTNPQNKSNKMFPINHYFLKVKYSRASMLDK